MPHENIHAAMHGTTGLILGYVSVAVPIALGLRRGGAQLKRQLLSPAIAIPVMFVAILASALEGPLLQGLGIDPDTVLGLAFALSTFVAIGYWSGRLLARGSSADSSYRRGAIVSPVAPASVTNTGLTLCGIAVAPEDETKHFKFIGTTGTGKSTAIRELLHTALKRADRAIIADPDGGYLANFYDPGRGDVILNPFDPDSVKWNLLDEITNDYDADQIARSLIPDTGDPDRTWNEHARAFFTAVAQQAIATGIKDDSEFYRLLTKAPVAELKILLAGTAAGPLLEDGNERMFGSVRSTTSSAVRALNYTTRQRGTPFSVRAWVRQAAERRAGGKGGVLFLPYKAGEIAALRSTISAWIRIAIFEALDCGEGDQRLWFVVDELDALGAIDGLKDALARLRKFGGRTIIGLQSIAQVSGTYGHAAADTIVENCGNTLILRCSASERGGTSEFASKLIGHREVMHTTRSTTRRPIEWFGSSTTSEHLKIEPAIMASEIERLPDLEGYLKFASTPDWRRVRLTPLRYPSVARRRAPPDAGPKTQTPATIVPNIPIPMTAAPTLPTASSAAKSTAAASKRSRKPRPAKDSIGPEPGGSPSPDDSQQDSP